MSHSGAHNCLVCEANVCLRETHVQIPPRKDLRSFLGGICTWVNKEVSTHPLKLISRTRFERFAWKSAFSIIHFSRVMGWWIVVCPPRPPNEKTWNCNIISVMELSVKTEGRRSSLLKLLLDINISNPIPTIWLKNSFFYMNFILKTRFLSWIFY